MARARPRLGSRRLALTVTLLILTAFAYAYALDIPPGFEGFQFTPPYHTRNPFDAAELEKIDAGFAVFNNEQFSGNGRTCSTCHLPAKNFNISVADIQALPSADKLKVLGGTNAVLENAEILGVLGLFNINQGFGADSEGTVHAPAGPFRASMSVGGLGFSTLNRFVCRGGPTAEPTVTMNGCALALTPTPSGSTITFTVPLTTGVPDPREFTLYKGAAPGTLVPTGDYTLSGRTVTMSAPLAAAGTRLVAYFPGSGTAVDDGTRDIMLGWAGDGALKEMFGYAGAPVLPAAACEAAVDDFLADLTNLEHALATFSLAAVKTHFPSSQNRTPGVDFRCPTSTELRDIAKFQKWLGRRFELDITKLVILAKDAETGRRLFSTRLASCVACHVNAGASDNQGRRKLDPVPFLHFSDGTPDPFLNGGTTSALEIAGANKSSRNGVKFLEPTLQGFLTAPLVFPTDHGDESLRGGSGGQGGFNVQSIIEATRKTQFFHDNGVEGTIEDAIAHYFTDNFHNSQGGAAIRNAFRGGSTVTAAQALAALEALSPDPIQKMGLFLRALSAVYSLTDCERFVDEIVLRMDHGLSTDLPVTNCGFALSDAKRVLEGIQVSPNPYRNVPRRIALIEEKLAQALAATNTASAKNRLRGVEGILQGTRNSIFTTTELP